MGNSKRFRHWYTIYLAVLAVLILGCNPDPADTELEAYYLTWRMMESMQADDLTTARMQYDSLRRSGGVIQQGSAVRTSAVILQLLGGDTAEAIRILEKMPGELGHDLCQTGMLRDAAYCALAKAAPPATLPTWQAE